MKQNVYFFTLIMAFSLTITAKAQFPTNPETGLVQFEEVIEIPDLTQEEIYKKAKSWMVTSLKSSDQMTDLNDDSLEKLVGTGTIIIDSLKLPYWGKSYSPKTYLNFKFLILIKEGRLKYRIENILLYYTNNEIIETSLENIKPARSNWTKKMKEEFQEHVYKSVTKAVDKLTLNFKYNMTLKEDNDW